MTSDAAAIEVLRPVRHGLTRARLAALLCATVPPAAVVAVLAADSGHVLPAALLIALAVATIAAATAVAVLHGIVLEPGLVRSRRHSDSRVIRATDVGRSVLRRIENRDELSSQRNLFLVGRSGRTLLRMSDRWWTEQQMARVVDHLGVALETAEESVYLSELRRTAREQLRWQERHVYAWIAVRIVLISGAALLTAALADAAI